MSVVYSAGVKATAIAGITAAINARITTIADGTKDLNRESLAAWLRAEYNSMQGPEASSRAYLTRINVNALVASLNTAIRREVFHNRSDWPTASNASYDSQVAAARTLQAELKVISDEVAQVYAGTPERAYRVIAAYGAKEVESGITPGVQRLLISQAYIATYVTDRDEESAPSPVSALVELDQNDTMSVTMPAAPSGRNITHFRLYRSSTSSTAAAFLMVENPSDVKGFPISVLTRTDSAKAQALQETCPSMAWAEPPANLVGLVGGANGGMAGFFGNEFCPCENYIPYAFPVEYRITTEHPIVGLGTYGQTYVVLTRGRPYLISGADSASLAALKLESEQACVSRASIVSTEMGVIFASPDGLCAISQGGVQMLTANHFSREQWAALVPSSIIAAENEGAYVFRWNAGATNGVYALDLKSGKLTTVVNSGTAFHRDLITDTLYVADGITIKAMFASASRRTAVWKSKRIVLPEHAGFAWLQADSNYEAGITVRLSMDGVLLHTAALTSRDPVRLPPGISNEWEVEVESAASITSVTVASTTDELKAV